MEIFKKDIFPHIKLQRYKKEEVIYATGREVHIILIGEAIMKSHEQQVYPSKLLAKYGEGDVIGSVYDSKETLKLENW